MDKVFNNLIDILMKIENIWKDNLYTCCNFGYAVKNNVATKDYNWNCKL